MFRIHNFNMGLRKIFGSKREEATFSKKKSYIRIIKRELQNYSSHEIAVGSRTQENETVRLKKHGKTLTGKI